MDGVKEFFINILKGIGIAVLVMLVGVLIFALLVKICAFNNTVIKAVNQFIKILAIFIGCFFSLKQGKGLIKGCIVGIVSICIMYLIFLILGCSISKGLSVFLDFVFALIAGGVSGIIAVNVKGRR